MSGPVPSNLVLLSDVERCAPGTKVRFLGCVDEYIVKSANLRVKHKHSATGPLATVNVNVDHVLERLKPHELDVGTWINVIGHVEQRKERGVYVQAVAIWDAGNVDLDAYQKAVERRKEAS
ncbi:CST complex subunit Ten1 [Paraphoma chrysanthemicola]|uniref:CST complex subunit Ten1 n=1 Tax=Paraphoma chrysanthemicola TaxID=798071 RepID=A0A8K0RJ51_9PLEO|nr:CST complex subunit Ten1 [Paraphoma chrysanthemicola]